MRYSSDLHIVQPSSAQMLEVLRDCRERPLGEFVDVYLDAHSEKVRQDGQIRDAAVLLAAGVSPY
jgi:transposase-like protein